MNKFNESFNNILHAKLNELNIKNTKLDNGIYIKIANKKYDSILINSNTGEIFFNNKFKNIKKIASIKDFNGKTVKEASLCVNKKINSIKKIINASNTINLIDTRQIKTSNRKDLRDNNYSIVYIDGHFMTAKTHSKAIHNYLKKFANQIRNNENFNIDNYIHTIALMNKNKNRIIVSNTKNIPNNVLFTKILNEYPNYKIIFDNRNNNINNSKNRIDMRTATHDIQTRDFAIVLINGDTFSTGKTHVEAIQKYLNKIDSSHKLIDKYSRPFMPNEYEEEENDIDINIDVNNLQGIDKDKYDSKIIEKYINSAAFAHYCNDALEKGIFIEEYSLYNITLDEAVKKFKQEYPNMKIYSDDNEDNNDDDYNIDDYDDTGYRLLAKVIKNHLEKTAFNVKRKRFKDIVNKYNNKSIKMANHDVDTRDFAIVLINGDTFSTGETHADAIQSYLMNINSKHMLNDSYQRPIMPNGYGQEKNKVDIDNDDLDEVDPDQYDTKVVDRYIKSAAFAHYCDDYIEKGIFIEEYSLYNITLDEAVKKFKQEYPNMNIYSDDEEDEDNEDTGYKLLAKVIKNNLKKTAFNIERKRFKNIVNKYNNRTIKTADHDSYNRTEAIAIINGKIYTGETHAEAINIYLDELKKDNLSDNYQRPPIPRRTLPKVNDEEFNNMESDEYKDMYVIDKYVDSLAFAHLVEPGDGDTYWEEGIFIEEYSLYNTTIKEVANILKQSYPDKKIYNDDVQTDNGYKIVAYLKDKSLKKISNKLKNN